LAIIKECAMTRTIVRKLSDGEELVIMFHTPVAHGQQDPREPALERRAILGAGVATPQSASPRRRAVLARRPHSAG